ncbi:MAG: MFS transporter [Litorimonas sp.]
MTAVEKDTASPRASLKPNLPLLSIFNMAIGFFGLQIGFALQNANGSRIFSSLGAEPDTLALYWLAGPVTGLVIQPIVGYFSDKTWTRFGRRRPYFLLGALLASFALVFMPNSSALWIAASSLWILDSAINISMEPFRAFVGDNLNTKQRTLGYAIQGFFIGAGGYVGSKLPEWATVLGASNTAEGLAVPDSVKLAFLIGAILLFASVLWTVLTSKEYTSEELRNFESADTSTLAIARQADRVVPPARSFGLAAIGFAALSILTFGLIAVDVAERQLSVFAVMVGILAVLLGYNALRLKAARAPGMIGILMDDLATMPVLMKRLALVQFCSWFAFFTLWVYLQPAVTSFHFATTDTSTQAYGDGSLAVNNIFAVYSLVAWGFSLLIPLITRSIGLKPTYALSLIVGGLSFISIWQLPPNLFWLSAIGIGIVWACVLTLPYAILADALPAERMGTYMGIFNYFIVIPQLIVGTIMGTVLTKILGGESVLTLVIAGGVMMMGAILLVFVPYKEAE